VRGPNIELSCWASGAAFGGHGDWSIPPRYRAANMTRRRSDRVDVVESCWVNFCLSPIAGPLAAARFVALGRLGAVFIAMGDLAAATLMNGADRTALKTADCAEKRRKVNLGRAVAQLLYFWFAIRVRRSGPLLRAWHGPVLFLFIHRARHLSIPANTG